MLKRGISGVDLHRMTGISEASITNIKYGSDLYLSTAKKIAKALNTKIEYIWPDQEEINGRMQNIHYGDDVNRIREILKARGMTQVELSELTGIQQSELSRIINDQKPNLSLRIAKKIAKALDCSIEDIWPEQAIFFISEILSV